MLRLRALLNVLTSVSESPTVDILWVVLIKGFFLEVFVSLLPLCFNLFEVHSLTFFSRLCSFNILRRNLVSHLAMRTLELELEVFKARLHQSVLVVLLLRFAEGLMQSFVLGVVGHLLLVVLVFTVVGKSAAVLHIPRVLLVIVLAAELSLLGGALQRDFLEVD